MPFSAERPGIYVLEGGRSVPAPSISPRQTELKYLSSERVEALGNVAKAVGLGVAAIAAGPALGVAAMVAAGMGLGVGIGFALPALVGTDEDLALLNEGWGYISGPFEATGSLVGAILGGEKGLRTGSKWGAGASKVNTLVAGTTLEKAVEIGEAILKMKSDSGFPPPEPKDGGPRRPDGNDRETRPPRSDRPRGSIDNYRLVVDLPHGPSRRVPSLP